MYAGVEAEKEQMKQSKGRREAKTGKRIISFSMPYLVLLLEDWGDTKVSHIHGSKGKTIMDTSLQTCR